MTNYCLSVIILNVYNCKCITNTNFTSIYTLLQQKLHCKHNLKLDLGYNIIINALNPFKLILTTHLKYHKFMQKYLFI